MKTVKKSEFERAMRQRGYALAELTSCIVSETDEEVTFDETHPSYPKARRGLGDVVAAGLSAVGITPDRVSAALGVKDCGCKQRQQKLNELGRRIGIG
jgi:hypothetical protein